MSRQLERRLVSVTLYGATIGVLTFFYLPILTLVAFSFRSGPTHYPFPITLLFPFPTSHYEEARRFPAGLLCKTSLQGI